MSSEPSSPRQHFEAIAAALDDEITLDEAALWIAAEDDPSLKVGAYLERIDALAERAGARIAPARSDVDRARAINQLLFQELGFAGNREDYYDPRNSYLNQVIDRRLGIPITLSVLYIAVASRLGLDVRGIGFPGHFLLKWVGDGQIIVDAFEGVVLSEAECQQRLDAVVGRHVALRPELHLRTASPREILLRMLGNLKQIFVARRAWMRALDCSERILLLHPEEPHELRDRGLVLERLECFTAAASDLDQFLALAPEDPSAPAVRRRRAALRGRIQRLH